MNESPNVSVEEKHNQASRKLVTYLIASAAIELVLIVIAVAIYFYATSRGQEVPFELMLVGIGVLSALGLIPFMFLALRAGKLQALFWKETAAELGYEYVHRPDLDTKGLVLRDGHNGKTGHGLTGTVMEHPFRLFQYSYETGLGKSSETHFYAVLEVSFAGAFPHLYLNNRHNRDLFETKESVLPQIPVPWEFEKKFRLYGPKGYEMEALQIFTPDVFAHLLDEGWEHDFELVDQKLLIFREKSITGKVQLVEEVERLKRCLTYLAPKLDRFRLTPIGNLKHHL